MFLTEFDFKNSPLQFYKAPNGEPVVTASSLVRALKGDPNNAAAIARANVRPKWIIQIPTPKGGKPTLCLFEPGAYQLAGNPMFQTDLAEEFQDWLFEDVLPKLRSRGIYAVKQTDETLAEYQEREAKLTEFNQKLLEEKQHLTQQLGKATRELKYWGVEFGEPQKVNLQNMRYQQVYSELQDLCPRQIWVAAHKRAVKLCPELTSIIPASMLK